MQTECQRYCSKLQENVVLGPGLKTQDIKKSERLSGTTNKSIINNRRSPSQSHKSVHIGEVTSVETTDSFRKGLRDTKTSSERTTSARDNGKDTHTGVYGGNSTAPKSLPQVQVGNRKSGRSNDSVESGNRILNESSIKHGKMSAKGGASSADSEAQSVDWDSNSHNPCPPTCPMTEARERAIRKAQLRQERLDDYLLNKGFRYFDDLCTCSPICMMTQLRRDKFVQDMFKSVCLFSLGVKLCDELDSWNLFG